MEKVQNPADSGEIKRLPITIALVLAGFVTILNETLLNMAYNVMMVELNVGPTTIQWLSTIYMLIIGILVPITALIMQWITTRRMFLSALIFFLIGTLICGFAPRLEFLMFGRIVQAIGTGLLLPVMMNTILMIYPPAKRGTAMGMVGLVIMFGPAIGPTLSGFILNTLNWRWLFYSVAPLVLFAIIYGMIYLRNVTEVTKPKVDIFSIVLSTLAFGGIVFGFSQSEKGFSDPSVFIWLIIGFVGLILFIFRQLRANEPTLDFRVFKYPMFALAAIILVMMMMTLFSTLILIPIYLQGALLIAPMTAGLLLLPGGLLNGLLSPVCGRLFDRFGPRFLVWPGLVMILISIFFLGQITLDSSKYFIMAMNILMSVGLALVMMPVQTTGLNQLTRKLYPHGTAMLNTIQQVAAAIGTAFFMSIYAKGIAEKMGPNAGTDVPVTAEAMVFGMQKAFSVSLLICIAALFVGLFIKRSFSPDEEVHPA